MDRALKTNASINELAWYVKVFLRFLEAHIWRARLQLDGQCGIKFGLQDNEPTAMNTSKGHQIDTASKLAAITCAGTLART
jgi:hypothetical protein